MYGFPSDSFFVMRGLKGVASSEVRGEDKAELSRVNESIEDIVASDMLSKVASELALERRRGLCALRGTCKEVDDSISSVGTAISSRAEVSSMYCGYWLATVRNASLSKLACV